MKERPHKYFQRTSMKKTMFHVTMCGYVKQTFLYFLSKNLHPDFHNPNVKKNPHFLQNISCLYFHVWYTENSYFKMENLSPDLYMWIMENFMFHTLKSSSRFSYVKLRISSFMENYLISDVYTWNIILSSRGTLITIFLLSFWCCHWGN